MANKKTKVKKNPGDKKRKVEAKGKAKGGKGAR